MLPCQAAFIGGVSDNRITGFSGESATGKSWFMIAIMKEFLAKNPKGCVIYYDTEAALTAKLLVDRNIDAESVIIASHPTLEAFRDHCFDKLEAYEEMTEKERKDEPLMIILDSLGMLSSTAEMEAIAAGKGTADMTKARTVKSIFRTMTIKLAKLRVPFLITNHIYTAIGQGNANYTPKVASGGSRISVCPQRGRRAV